MKKVLLIILIIVATTLLINVGDFIYQNYLWTKMPNQTSSWQTYTNTEYGFEIKYPAGFVKKDGQSFYGDTFYNVDQNAPIKWIRMGIATSITREISFKDYGIDYENKKIIPGYSAEKIYKLPAVYGEKSVTFETIGSITPAKDLTTLIQGLNNTIEIEIYACTDAQISDMEKISDRMLSTFEFTSPITDQYGRPIPIINNISPDSGTAGTSVEIKGSGFAGFESDLNLWIENSEGVKGIIYGDKNSSNGNSIKFVLPATACQEDNSYSGLPCSKTLQLTPGNYKIYVLPWGSKSNEVNFKIK